MAVQLAANKLGETALAGESWASSDGIAGAACSTDTSVQVEPAGSPKQLSKRKLDSPCGSGIGDGLVGHHQHPRSSPRRAWRAPSPCAKEASAYGNANTHRLFHPCGALPGAPRGSTGSQRTPRPFLSLAYPRFKIGPRGRDLLGRHAKRITGHVPLQRAWPKRRQRKGGFYLNSAGAAANKSNSAPPAFYLYAQGRGEAGRKATQRPGRWPRCACPIGPRQAKLRHRAGFGH